MESQEIGLILGVIVLDPRKSPSRKDSRMVLWLREAQFGSSARITDLRICVDLILQYFQGPKHLGKLGWFLVEHVAHCTVVAL